MNNLALTIGIIILFSIALVMSVTLGAQPEDLDEYEECVREEYGMSPTEYYQATNQEPVCPETN